MALREPEKASGFSEWADYILVYPSREDFTPINVILNEQRTSIRC